MEYYLKNNILTIENPDEKTVLDFFLAHNQSKKNRYLYIQEKRVLIDGEIVKDIHAPISGKQLTLIFKEEGIDWVCADKPLCVIYEDDFVYIAHKEAGTIVHSDLKDKNCLNAQAATYQKDKGIFMPVRPIHRLDKDTQGLILYSKLPFFQPDLDKALKERTIKRVYLAICIGSCKIGKTFVVEKPIGKDRHKNGVYRVSKSGQYAKTTFTCVKEDNGLVYFLCELDTGRTHQIRVHLSYLGYPIINDPIYGKKHPISSTMGLWAKEITFPHPLNNKKVKIYDTIKEDLPWENNNHEI